MTGGFYVPAGSRTNQKRKATNLTSRRRGEGEPTPSGFTHLTLLARDNKPTAHGQRELPFCVGARRSTGGGSVDLENRMATADNKTNRLDRGEQRRKPQAGVAYITVVYLLYLYCTAKVGSPMKGYIPYVPPSPPTRVWPYTSSNTHRGLEEVSG